MNNTFTSDRSLFHQLKTTQKSIMWEEPYKGTQSPINSNRLNVQCHILFQNNLLYCTIATMPRDTNYCSSRQCP